MFGTPGSAGLPFWCLKSVFFRLLGSPAQIDPQLLPCRFKKRWGFPAAFQMGRWENVPRGSVPSLVLCLP